MADLLRIEREAQKRGFNSAEFWISAPRGVFKAKWLDAYFGVFLIPELGGGALRGGDLPPNFEGFWAKEEAEEHNKREFGELQAILRAAGFMQQE